MSSELKPGVLSAIWVGIEFILERTIFVLLYAMATTFDNMDDEADDVFEDALSSPKSPKNSSPRAFPGRPGVYEMKTINGDDLDESQLMGMRSMSMPTIRDKNVPARPPSPKSPAPNAVTKLNPVKEFIINFASRAHKKRTPLKRSTTTEDVSNQIIKQLGRGHSFLPMSLINPTWCDFCGEFIWGLYKQSVRCKFCKYTCHRRCRDEVELDCIGGDWPKIERNMSVDEMTLGKLHLIEQNDDRATVPFMVHDILTKDALRRRVEEFNSATTGLIMTMRDEETFQGFIRVHMNLLRPINVVAGERPLSIFEAVAWKGDDPLNAEMVGPKASQRTSFFLPLGTVKALHITSQTTVHEVIVALLKKFKIADNPRKFALFECYQDEDKHVILRRMSDLEKPLCLRLLWGGGDIRHSFSLQENETGDIVVSQTF